MAKKQNYFSVNYDDEQDIRHRIEKSFQSGGKSLKSTLNETYLLPE
ncbi:MAG: hypothetical protein ACE5IR_17140 [bacterium]